MRTIHAAILLPIFVLAACATPSRVSPSASAPAAERAAVVTAASGAPSPAATIAATPTGSDPQTAATPAASALDTAPPVVTLSAEPAVIPWLEQSAIRASAQDNTGVVGLEVLLGDQLLGTASDGDLSLDLIPGALDAMTPGGTYTLTARAVDAAGNVGEAALTVSLSAQPDAGEPLPDAAVIYTVTPVATATTYLPHVAAAGTPTPQPTPKPTRPVDSVSYRVTEITLSTYPYAPHLRQTTDPNLGDYPVTVFDRAAYEASNPQPAAKKHRLIVLENRYLRLGILPDLGGRIYEATFKPTGNNEFYSNPAVKPTTWGLANPPGANWWLGIGGLEWDFPMEEHGYEFGRPWGFDHVTMPNGGVMLTLFTRYGPQIPYAVVDVILPPDAAYFVVQPRITNPWGSVFRFKWWDSVMLAPGAANSLSPDLQLIFPASEVTIHSTGDPTLPAAGQPMAWPIYNGRDFSQLQNWNQYLGVFQRPAATGNFVGVYDAAADEGMLRIYPNDVTHGAKIFSPGWSDPLDSKLWTDDGSGYVELHGGLVPTFNDWYELEPGGEITWSEVWYPVAGIGAVTAASEDAALSLHSDGKTLRVGIFPTYPLQGQVKIAVQGMDPVVRAIDSDPAQPLTVDILLAGGVPVQAAVAVDLIDADGALLFSSQAQIQVR